MKNFTQEEGDNAVTAVLYSMFVVESMDVLRDTQMYSGNVKKFGNLFINALKKTINLNSAMQDENAKVTNNLFIDNEALVQKVVKGGVKELAIINQMLDHYRERPDMWEDFYKFKELNNETNPK